MTVMVHELSSVSTKFHLIKLIPAEGKVFECVVMRNQKNKGNKKRTGEM